MVGYDPSGTTVFIGEGANKDLINLLYAIDKSKTPHLLWKQLKDLISELHWKTISFLIENYDVILLPDFRISGMVKGKKLGRMTKRLLYMFSFHSFKTKLQYKCKMYNKKLIIVDESYTSRTCTNCGILRPKSGSETFKCKHCKVTIDRDVVGSRNIFLKNIRLR